MKSGVRLLVKTYGVVNLAVATKIMYNKVTTVVTPIDKMEC